MATNTDDKVAKIIRSLKNKYVIVFLIISAIAGFSTFTDNVTKIINSIKSLFSQTEKPSNGPSIKVEPGATVGAIIQGNGNQIIQQTITPETIALAKELGVTQAALQNFFKILQEGNVKPEDYDHTLRTIAERYLNNLKQLSALQADDPAVKTFLQQAKRALEQGQFDEAERLINDAKNTDLEAAKTLQETANKRLFAAAAAAAQNGAIQMTQIHYLKAAGYYQEAASLIPDTFSKLADHLDAAGQALYYAGKYEQAEPLFCRSLAINEKALGKDHPNVANSLNNLATLYLAQGKYKEAEPLYSRSLAIKEKALDKDHPAVAVNLNNLASLYQAQGKYEQAEPLYSRSLAICEKVLGKDHPNVAQSLNNLALLYYTQGKYEQAEPLYSRSFAICEKALGKDHQDVAKSLNNLAGLYQAQGKYEQAEPLFSRSLAIFEKALGKDHPNTETIRNNLQKLQARLKEQRQGTEKGKP